MYKIKRWRGREDDYLDQSRRKIRSAVPRNAPKDRWDSLFLTWATALSPLILTTTNLHPSLTPGSFPRVIFYISINSYQTYVQNSLKACLLDEFNVFPNGLSSYFTFNSTPMSARNSPTLVAWLSCVNRSISVQSWCLISLNAKMLQSEIPKT